MTSATTAPVGSAVLLSYERSGASVTGVGETLTVSSSGALDFRLTGGGPRIGRFTGRLGDDQLGALRAAVARLPGPFASPDPIAPESVTESLNASGVSATITGNGRVPAEWLDLLRLVHEDTIRLTSSPVAAIELTAEMNRTSGRLRGELRQLGSEAVRLAGGPVEISISVLGRSDVVRARWSITDALEATDAGPGWVRDLGLGRSDAIPKANETLVIGVKLSVAGADGIVRPARLGLSRP